MTIPQSTKDAFLVLRTEGKSYERIAKELKVSKHTLVQWGKELKTEIENLRAFRLELLQEEYHVLKERRLELIGQKLQSIIDELARRRLTEISTQKLFDLLLKYTTALRKDEQQIKITEPDTQPSRRIPITADDIHRVLQGSGQRLLRLQNSLQKPKTTPPTDPQSDHN